MPGIFLLDKTVIQLHELVEENMKTKTAEENILISGVKVVPLSQGNNAKVEVLAKDGNLVIDEIADYQPILADGELEYF